MTGLLPSGLPDSVANEEDLARVLRSSGHYSSSFVKAAAFMPAPKDAMTSVIRHGSEPREELWKLAELFLGIPPRHGAAICKARVVREQSLEVGAKEPPPRHANIVGWPVNADPELQKAQQKELALAIAAQSELVRIES
jgi:hypothetical protein